MPVIPTYSTGIGAPDLAGAFLGGRRLAQQAYSDAQRIQLGREEIAQRAVQNEMELAAKKEALSRESLRKAQEAEILKAYRETQLGLAEGRLRNQEALAELRIQQAAIDFDKMQNYQRRVQELTGKNIPLEEAARQAILEYGGTGLSTALERPNAPSALPEANFRYRQIQGQIDDLMRPYSGPMALAIPENVRTNVTALRQQQSQLLPPANAGKSVGGNRLIWNSKKGDFDSAPAASSGISTPRSVPAWQGPTQSKIFFGYPPGLTYQTDSETVTSRDIE